MKTNISEASEPGLERFLCLTVCNGVEVEESGGNVLTLWICGRL